MKNNAKINQKDIYFFASLSCLLSTYLVCLLKPGWGHTHTSRLQPFFFCSKKFRWSSPSSATFFYVNWPLKYTQVLPNLSLFTRGQPRAPDEKKENGTHSSFDRQGPRNIPEHQVAIIVLDSGWCQVVRSEWKDRWIFLQELPFNSKIFYLLHASSSHPRNPWPSISFYLNKGFKDGSRNWLYTHTGVVISVHEDANSLVAFFQEA